MNALVHYDAMRRELAEAHRIDEVKDIRDKARALEQYVRQAQDLEAERQCIEIRLRAEKRAGALLKEQKANGERASAGDAGGGTDGRGARRSVSPTLSDLGITRDQSSKWQQLDEVPEETFERALADPVVKPSTAGILRRHNGDPDPAPRVAGDPERVGAASLWLWGRLRDFERQALLDLDPAEMLEGMTHEMRADVARLAPLVARFLQEIADHDETPTQRTGRAGSRRTAEAIRGAG